MHPDRRRPLRRILLAGLIATAFALLTGTLVRIIYHPQTGAGITPESIARIQTGMTEEEVRNILGCPAGDYRPFILLVTHPAGAYSDDAIGLAPHAYGRIWRNEHVYVLVIFDRRTERVGHIAVQAKP